MRCSVDKKQNYQKVLFDDSSDESLGLVGEPFKLLLDNNDCSEGDVFKFVFDVLVGNENNVVGVEDDSVAFSFG